MNQLLIRLINSSVLDNRTLPGATYIPPSKPEEQEVRQSLGLHEPQLINALILARLVDAFPVFKGLVGEDSKSYDYWLEAIPMWSAPELAGRLLGTHRGPADVNTLSLEVMASNQVRLRSGKFASDVSYTHDGTYLEAAWPKWSGLSGKVEILDVESTTLSMPYNPVKVVWSEYTLALNNVSGLSEVLNTTGMFRAYHQAHSDAEAVAAACTALALYNNDISWSAA